MHHIHKKDWLFTPNGDARGYIQPQLLRELWFHTGTICNLSCPFCLEGSRPGDNRLNQITFLEAKSFIDEALCLGVEQFSFTGGEPFVIRDIFQILGYALRYRPCLVLTNGTDPILKRMQQVKELKQHPHPISFRISIDFPDPASHDAGRGKGNFWKSMQTLAQLHELGFAVSIARQETPGENREEVNQAYLPYFRRMGLPDDLHIVVFPDFLTPGSIKQVPHITENCMTTYKDERSRAEFMCNYSKMVVKRNGRMRVYACTLVDDDPDYDLGGTLTEAMKVRVMLKHHRCYSCFAFGASCSELNVRTESAQKIPLTIQLSPMD